MTTTSDYAALLAACIAHPDEDTPRLALADCIDENDGDHEHAELIRVQCELAREMEPYPGWHVDSLDMLCPMDDREAQQWKRRVQALARRERAIIAANEARWRKGPACGACRNGIATCTDCIHWKGRPPKDCRCGATRKAACRRCDGTGDAGGLVAYRSPYYESDGHRFAVPIQFRRGFIERVDVPTLGGAPAGGYRPSPWLRAVLTATPERGLIREVVPLDVRPNTETVQGEASWYFNDGAPRDYPHWLPVWLVEPMRTFTNAEMWGRHWDSGKLSLIKFPTPADAVTALGIAVVKWAREELPSD